MPIHRSFPRAAISRPAPANNTFELELADLGAQWAGRDKLKYAYKYILSGVDFRNDRRSASKPPRADGTRENEMKIKHLLFVAAASALWTSAVSAGSGNGNGNGNVGNGNGNGNVGNFNGNGNSGNYNGNFNIGNNNGNYNPDNNNGNFFNSDNNGNGQ